MEPASACRPGPGARSQPASHHGGHARVGFAPPGAGPLDPAFGARLRWVAARANRCRYSEAYAEGDLRRAGIDAVALRDFMADPLKGPDSDALVFAHKLTRAASTIEDADVARLIDQYGEKQVVALVLLLAYANFQDRLILALDIPLEPDGPLAPAEVGFKPIPLGARLAAPRTAVPPAVANAAREEDAEWLDLALPDLRQGLERQRTRTPRIPLPSREAGGPLWGLVCADYQPELAGAWSACAWAFEAEADTDPDLRAEPVLGHYPHLALLLLNGPYGDAARGRGPGQSSHRGARPGAWPAATGRRSLPPERAAFRFARKQARDPAVDHGGGLSPAGGPLRARTRPRHRLVELPLPLHDVRCRRLPVAPGSGERLRRLPPRPRPGRRRRNRGRAAWGRTTSQGGPDLSGRVAAPVRSDRQVEAWTGGAVPAIPPGPGRLLR